MADLQDSLWLVGLLLKQTPAVWWQNTECQIASQDTSGLDENLTDSHRPCPQHNLYSDWPCRRRQACRRPHSSQCLNCLQLPLEMAAPSCGLLRFLLKPTTKENTKRARIKAIWGERFNLAWLKKNRLITRDLCTLGFYDSASAFKFKHTLQVDDALLNLIWNVFSLFRFIAGMECYTCTLYIFVPIGCCCPAGHVRIGGHCQYCTSGSSLLYNFVSEAQIGRYFYISQ